MPTHANLINTYQKENLIELYSNITPVSLCIMQSQFQFGYIYLENKYQYLGNIAFNLLVIFSLPFLFLLGIKTKQRNLTIKRIKIINMIIMRNQTINILCVTEVLCLCNARDKATLIKIIFSKRSSSTVLILIKY